MFRQLSATLAATVVAVIAGYTLAYGDAGHKKAPKPKDSFEQMRDMHKGHSHAHDFEAIENMPPEEMRRVMNAMMEIGIAVPPMSAHAGRELFVTKGCVVCHQVNGIGGEIGPSLDAADMPAPMNAFEFAARMWRGADAMIAMQRELFGEQVQLTGQELLDLVAFAHDASEQQELSEDQIPPELRRLIE